jgi:hypothetical protein
MVDFSNLDFHIEQRQDGKYNLVIKTWFTDNKEVENLADDLIKGIENGNIIVKIRELMKWNNQLGGRMTLEDTEQVMYLVTGEYHNSKCPECAKNVSCVCTSKCNHIWYCPDHILNHSHRNTIHSEG